MDTNEAIATLKAIANTLTDEVKGAQAKLDAVNLAISQLQGTLTTQLAELDQEKLKCQRLFDNNTALTARINDLQAPLDALQPAATLQ